MTDFLKTAKQALQEEMYKLHSEDNKISSDLSQYFGMLRNGKSGNSKLLSLDLSDISKSISTIEATGPTFEVMLQDSKKLVGQVEDGRLLSDRLSSLVRRLDVMQIRSQQALACTEDIINMKESKIKMCAAMETGDLAQAVGCVRQVHEIDVRAARTSEDYGVILQKEKELQDMVRSEFAAAIQKADIAAVMALCPLLQTLGLEIEARESFLDFAESSIFGAVSADVGASRDEVTGYAQALSGIFNSAYLIIQRFLPMVIQGLESSHGDVHFIRRLHAKVQAEAGRVLKGYMKFRNVAGMVAHCAAAGSKNTPTPALSAAGSSGVGKPQVWSSADVHGVLDELALHIQYCSRYTQFVKHVCAGAEAKTRRKVSGEPPFSVPGESQSAEDSRVVVFPPGAALSSFEDMQADLVHKYYLVGEQWLMRCSVRSALSAVGRAAADDSNSSPLDECFFVLQKCGLRAIATHDIRAACAVLSDMTGFASSELLTQGTEALLAAANRVGAALADHMALYQRCILVDSGSAAEDSSTAAGAAASLSNGLKNLHQLQQQLVSGSSSGAVGGAGPSGANGDMSLHPDGGFYFGSGTAADPEDVWGVGPSMAAFVSIELCARYTERLGRDLWDAGQAVFAASEEDPAPRAVPDRSAAMGKSSRSTAAAALSRGPLDQLRLCKEDFDACGTAFSNALRQGADRLASSSQPVMRDMLTAVLGRGGPFGGVRFDVSDALFDAQPALNLLPKALTLPLETVVGICTFRLSERCKDMVVGLLAEACAVKLEQFATQASFRFAGALKFEELVRSLGALLGRHSGLPVRGKFARLREVLQVITAEGPPQSRGGRAADSFTHLTAAEVDALAALRVDFVR